MTNPLTDKTTPKVILRRALHVIKLAFAVATVLMLIILTLLAFPYLLQTTSFIAHPNLSYLYIALIHFWSLVIVIWGVKP